MKRLLIVAGVLTPLSVVGLLLSPHDAQAKDPTIKEIMGKLHKGANAPLGVLKRDLQSDDPPWPEIQRVSREFLIHGAALYKNTPPKGERVPLRGTVVHLGARQRLLCLKDGSLMLRPTDPMPQPIRLELHKQSTYDKMDPLTKQVLDFAGLSWRSSRCIFEPVTTYYAHLIADMLNRLSTVEGWSDSALDTQLARSRWFL